MILILILTWKSNNDLLLSSVMSFIISRIHSIVNLKIELYSFFLWHIHSLNYRSPSSMYQWLIELRAHFTWLRYPLTQSTSCRQRLPFLSLPYFYLTLLISIIIFLLRLLLPLCQLSIVVNIMAAPVSSLLANLPCRDQSNFKKISATRRPARSVWIYISLSLTPYHDTYIYIYIIIERYVECYTRLYFIHTLKRVTCVARW